MVARKGIISTPPDKNSIFCIAYNYYEGHALLKTAVKIEQKN
jgi:hypothetical protein